MTRVTLDSNIYISALVFGGKPMRLLAAAIEGEIEVAISAPIVEEVRRVLQTKFGWSEERVVEAMETIGVAAEPVTATITLDVIQTDPDDNRVMECAVAAGSEFIVSGDSDLLAIGSFDGIAIVTASEFLARFEGPGL